MFQRDPTLLMKLFLISLDWLEELFTKFVVLYYIFILAFSVFRPRNAGRKMFCHLQKYTFTVKSKIDGQAKFHFFFSDHLLKLFHFSETWLCCPIHVFITSVQKIRDNTIQKIEEQQRQLIIKELRKFIVTCFRNFWEHILF